MKNNHPQMMSMTGYGKEIFHNQKRQITIEIKSLNNRYFEYQIKGSQKVQAIEQDIAKLLKKHINRGAIIVNANIIEFGDQSFEPIINIDLAQSYKAIIEKSANKLKISNNMDSKFIFSLPEVLKVVSQDSINNEVLQKDVLNTVKKAIAKFNEMRSNEGSFLAKDIIRRNKKIIFFLQKIAKLAPKRIEKYRQRLYDKISEFDMNVDKDLKNRLVSEIAIMTDKIDISEEILRLKSHLNQFRISIEQGGPVGKRLNFILQEINREINTICSKAGDPDIIDLGILIKEQTEKIREQVQNLE